MAKRRRILVIKPSSLGDVVHGLQVASTIKDRLPNAAIDWVAGDKFADVVRASGIAENVFLFYRGGGLRKFVVLLREIRKFHYDYVFDMQGLARSGAMVYFARGDRKIGRTDAREFAWLAYHRKVPLPRATSPHAIEILLQFLPEVGLPAELRSKLSFAANLSDEIRKLLPSTPHGKLPMLLLFPESRRREKEWPYFAELANALAQEFSNFTTVVAAQKTFTIVGNFQNITNLSGKTSITDVISLVKMATLVVANDSAPVHLASAMGIPVIALFGPTDPQRFGPYPASERKNVALRAADKNLSAISVGEVMAAVGSILNLPDSGG
ncbi:MAG: glycosyltransferase family 9 protein [Puniceicoccales bacterium]|jgi:ADP-heptose:LPS heptosyltransferase|nr:glycosyltransferase family 9 protein [Puniceicoccales bacterium]